MLSFGLLWYFMSTQINLSLVSNYPNTPLGYTKSVRNSYQSVLTRVVLQRVAMGHKLITVSG